jgi:hypothetical protein
MRWLVSHCRLLVHTPEGMEGSECLPGSHARSAVWVVRSAQEVGRERQVDSRPHPGEVSSSVRRRLDQ